MNREQTSEKMGGSKRKYLLNFLLNASDTLSVAMKDGIWILMILFVATVLRFPGIDHPNEPVFDERIYGAFIMLPTIGQLHFDIHPPLIRILMIEQAKKEGFTVTGKNTTEIFNSKDSFHHFPYARLRQVVAFTGSLIPILVFILLRLLKRKAWVAGVLGLIVAMESSLIIYSRMFLPDSAMLLFSFGAIATAMVAVRQTKTLLRNSLFLLSAVLIAAAISIKWLALGVLGVIGLLYLHERRFGAIVGMVIVTGIVYVGSFLYFLGYFPNGGRVDPTMPSYQTSYISALELAQNPTFREKIIFLKELHLAIWRSNGDSNITEQLPSSPHPLAWAVAKVHLVIWWPEDRPEQIVLQGNSLLWNIALFLFIFEILWVGAHVVTEKRWPIGRDETLLVIGYLANYVPFFFIDRPMYLYHYFTALLFLILLVPMVSPRLLRCLTLLTKDRRLPTVLATLVVCLIFLISLSLLPTTYGV